MFTISQISQTSTGFKPQNKVAKPIFKGINKKIVNNIIPQVRIDSKIAFKYIENFAKGLEVMFNTIFIK